MNIVEATKEAMKAGKGITNSVCKECGDYLLPTNTDECYLIIPVGYSHTKGMRVAARWNPHADDILAEDWELY